MNAEQLAKDMEDTNARLRAVWPNDYILPDTDISYGSGWDRETRWLSIVCYATLTVLLLMPVSLAVYVYINS